MGTETVMTGTEVEELRTYRLDRLWSLQQLADAMARAGWPVAKKTLGNLLGEPGKVQPQDVTRYAIRKFLTLEREAGRLPVRPEARTA